MKQELRLIITQLCNFDCYFCHHEGIKTKKEDLMNADDIEYLYRVANKYLNINSVTISGGEPLIINSIVDIVEKLNKLGCETTIVTNGSLLNKRMIIGKYIKKLNISIHSLEKKEYENIVRKQNVFDTVIKNICQFRKEYPNVEINLNYALINKANIKDKIKEIIDFAKENNVNVKFIELFPKNSEEYIPIEKLHNELVKHNHKLLSEGKRKNKYSNSDKSSIYTTKCLCSRALDFDSPSEFCHKNNDLFIAQDGTVQLCRLIKDEVTMLEEIKTRNTKELINKLMISFEKLGENCPYEK